MPLSYAHIPPFSLPQKLEWCVYWAKWTTETEVLRKMSHRLSCIRGWVSFWFSRAAGEGGGEAERKDFWRVYIFWQKILRRSCVLLFEINRELFCSRIPLHRLLPDLSLWLLDCKDHEDRHSIYPRWKTQIKVSISHWGLDELGPDTSVKMVDGLAWWWGKKLLPSHCGLQSFAFLPWQLARDRFREWYPGMAALQFFLRVHMDHTCCVKNRRTVTMAHGHW